jgi:hypothetical protein
VWGRGLRWKELGTQVEGAGDSGGRSWGLRWKELGTQVEGAGDSKVEGARGFPNT